MTARDFLLLWPSIATEAPTILLPLVGLILARSKLLPRGSASALATVGFVLLLVHSASQLTFQIYLARHAAESVLGWLAAFSLAQRILFVAALICLTCAIFVGRRRDQG